MKSIPNSVQQIKEYFNEQLFPHYEKEEIKNFCLLSFEKLLGITRSELRLKSEMVLQEDTAKKFLGIVEELLESKPIQYILGETEFYGIKLELDERVLIPRQETEELVDWILKEQGKAAFSRKEMKEEVSLNIIDIGTGSGCIALALKANLPDSNVYAMDVSKEALHVANANAQLNKLHINFVEGNIVSTSFSKEFESDFFDVVVSNPPYVCETEATLMHKNVLEFEPHLALFVPDQNPLLFYEAILTFAHTHLKKGAWVYFEINEAFGKEMIQLLNKFNYLQIELRKDLNGKNRMISAQKAE